MILKNGVSFKQIRATWFGNVAQLCTPGTTASGQQFSSGRTWVTYSIGCSLPTALLGRSCPSLVPQRKEM